MSTSDPQVTTEPDAPEESGPQASGSTSTTPFKPDKPRFGGLTKVGTDSWAAWVGGKPKVDWSELEQPNPASILPNQFRSASISTQAKSQYYQVKGLETKYTRDSDLLTFQKKMQKHLEQYGLDTITYLEDPSGKDKVVSVITDHAKFSLKAGVAKSKYTSSEYFDKYDYANDSDAKEFLLNSVDDELETQLYENCQDDDPFVVYWLNLIHHNFSVRVDRCVQMATEPKAMQPENRVGKPKNDDDYEYIPSSDSDSSPPIRSKTTPKRTKLSFSPSDAKKASGGPPSERNPFDTIMRAEIARLVELGHYQVDKVKDRELTSLWDVFTKFRDDTTRNERLHDIALNYAKIRLGYFPVRGNEFAAAVLACNLHHKAHGNKDVKTLPTDANWTLPLLILLNSHIKNETNLPPIRYRCLRANDVEWEPIRKRDTKQIWIRPDPDQEQVLTGVENRDSVVKKMILFLNQNIPDMLEVTAKPKGEFRIRNIMSEYTYKHMIFRIRNSPLGLAVTSNMVPHQGRWFESWSGWNPPLLTPKSEKILDSKSVRFLVPDGAGARRACVVCGKATLLRIAAIPRGSVRVYT